MGLRESLKMPKTTEYESLFNTKLNKELGLRHKGKILFLLSQENNEEIYNEDLYRRISTHVAKDPKKNGIHLQLVDEQDHKDFLVARLLTSTDDVQEECITISPRKDNPDTYVVSARTYWKLIGLALDPEHIKSDLEMSLQDAI